MTVSTYKFVSDKDVLAGYRWTVEEPKAIIYLIHGIGEHSYRYDKVAQLLNDAGFSLYSFDLRGHGRSPGKRGQIGKRAQVRSDIDNFIGILKDKYPDLPLIHYGHSLGGNISLDYRLRGRRSYEPKGYIITSPWVKLVRSIPNVLYRAVEIGARIAPDLSIKQNIDNEMLGNLSLIDQESHSEMRHQKITLQTAYEGYKIASELMDDNVQDMFGGGEKPLLLMHGSEDKICSIEGSRAIAHNYGEICQFIEWKDYLHELHKGTEDKSYKPVIDKMVSWVNEIIDQN